ncbi:hypothetical protein VKT23_005038 [Stygiomarasmius scandens]|uniref:Uncharacterized protein n=1 Tax=Marasmiellus scandens TaxID=2682957 RepID=A0ABR1JSJ3_9AGAR
MKIRMNDGGDLGMSDLEHNNLVGKFNMADVPVAFGSEASEINVPSTKVLRKSAGVLIGVFLIDHQWRHSTQRFRSTSNLESRIPTYIALGQSSTSAQCNAPIRQLPWVSVQFSE